MYYDSYMWAARTQKIVFRYTIYAESMSETDETESTEEYVYSSEEDQKRRRDNRGL